MKLIILGNGFDLHHKFKTSFYDFRKYLMDSKNKKDKILMSEIDSLLDINGNIQKEHLLWNDFEAIIGEILGTAKYKRSKIKNIPNLIEDFTQNFYEYLLKISEDDRIESNKKLALEFKDASAILTFNYTSIYSAYINKSDVDIFHIHGNLSDKDLPIIGYYYPNVSENITSNDYSIRFKKKLVHKPALAYKQNEIDLNNRIDKFVKKWKNKITEIVIIGYSFGESDSHIYKIINSIMVEQIKDNNVPFSLAKNINAIKFTIYSYNDDESMKLINKIKSNISKFGRKTSINITGVGFASKEKELLSFELKKY